VPRAESSGRLLRPAEEGPESCKHSNERDKELRCYAVEAPDFEFVGFDVGEVEGIGESKDGRKQSKAAAARERKHGKREIPDDSDGGYRDVSHHGVAAVVNNATIPMRIDVAGLDIIGVVNTEGKNRDNNAREGENSNQVTHGDSIFLRRGQVTATPIFRP
jgi:hypothetical protein